MRDLRNMSWIARFGAMRRLATALVVAAVAFVIQPNSISWHTRAVASWDLGALAYLGLAWVLIRRTDARLTRHHALSQDQSGYVMFLFVVGAACASIVAIGFVAGTIRDLPFWPRAWHLTLTITALVSSWLLIQTVFAFHYAHRYYAGPHGEPGITAPLRFPGGGDPDYLDFAYYAFVVGMTSQVSDVAVAHRRRRQLSRIQSSLNQMTKKADVASRRLLRRLAMAAKRGTLQSEDVDFLPLSDIMRDLLTISYFEGLDIKFAKEPSPFKSAIKALRELHVGDLEPRLKK